MRTNHFPWRDREKTFRTSFKSLCISYDCFFQLYWSRNITETCHKLLFKASPQRSQIIHPRIQFVAFVDIPATVLWTHVTITPLALFMHDDQADYQAFTGKHSPIKTQGIGAKNHEGVDVKGTGFRKGNACGSQSYLLVKNNSGPAMSGKHLQ